MTVAMNQDIAKAILLLQSWPDECLSLFKIQQSPSKSLFTMSEIRDQFCIFLQSFPVDLTLLHMVESKIF